MALSSEQLATLKAHIEASSDLNVHPNNSDGNVAVAALLNLPATPSFWAWRTAVMESEFTRAVSVDGTSWSWSTYIGRSQGERDAWARMFMGGLGGANPSLPNVRSGFADIFSGAGGLNQRTHLLAIARRLATRGEKLFATGTGSAADPAVMGHEGAVTASDVSEARNLP